MRPSVVSIATQTHLVRVSLFAIALARKRVSFSTPLPPAPGSSPQIAHFTLFHRLQLSLANLELVVHFYRHLCSLFEHAYVSDDGVILRR